MLDTGFRQELARTAAPTSSSTNESQTQEDAAGAAIQRRATILANAGSVARQAAEQWDEDGDLVLDPVAGHGTFIAGLIGQVAPAAGVQVCRVVGAHGDVSDWDVAKALYVEMVACAEHDNEAPFQVVNMSLGGVCEDNDPPIALAHAIALVEARWNDVPRAPRSMYRGRCEDPEVPVEAVAPVVRVVFVASAGNDTTCRETWPAAFANVIGVAALAPDGPAAFTNYGSWVDACAPGTDLVSTFFDIAAPAFDGADRFDGWAEWSGTSFSAPIVAAQIAFLYQVTALDLAAVVNRLVRNPQLLRWPGLGTVVNVC